MVCDTPVHIFNGFLNPFGGSEAEALHLYAGISQFAPTNLWGISSRLSPAFADWPIRRARLITGTFPRTGIFVFVGAHWLRRPWTLLARPARLIYVFNTFHPKLLSIVFRDVPRPGWPTAEVVFVSEFQRRWLGVTGGVIHPSPIDVDRFKPRGKPTNNRALTIGRMSRDTEDKHDPADFGLWRTLAERGHRVRLMGARRLTDPRLNHPLIERLPEGHEPAEQFLASLDVFYYRTGKVVETFGRVVLEAMACGLPVVCDRRGGYADHIESGRNGLLCSNTAEALRAIEALASDPSLRERLGNAARATAANLYAKPALADRMRFYTGTQRRAAKLRFVPSAVAANACVRSKGFDE